MRASRCVAGRAPCCVGLGLAVADRPAAHPLAGAASDVWGNVGPASPARLGRALRPLPAQQLRARPALRRGQASLTGGVDVYGVPPMIAYFLASVLWLLTSFLANLLITLFSFAFSLDLVNGSQATGGAGALGPVSQAIHSIYANVFGAPWLVLAITVAGLWAMWKALVQRRHSETAGALGPLAGLRRPGAVLRRPAGRDDRQRLEAGRTRCRRRSSRSPTTASPRAAGRRRKTPPTSSSNCSSSSPGSCSSSADSNTAPSPAPASSGSDPESAPVRPLSSNPARDAALARRLASGTEVTADGKVCVNNAQQVRARTSCASPRERRTGRRVRRAERRRLLQAARSRPGRRGYRLGVADKPATDAMEEGGQFQRLRLALVLFVGELGAFLLLGSLAVGIDPRPGTAAPAAGLRAGRARRRGDPRPRPRLLQRLAGEARRLPAAKAAYSLILATLLAVSGALASATAQLGWLMSFGLQALFFWAVFIQRKSLAESLIGIATGPGAPGREASVRLLALYAGARVGGRRRAAAATRRALGGAGAGPCCSAASSALAAAAAGRPQAGSGAPRLGSGPSAPVGGARRPRRSRPWRAATRERRGRRRFAGRAVAPEPGERSPYPAPRGAASAKGGRAGARPPAVPRSPSAGKQSEGQSERGEAAPASAPASARRSDRRRAAAEPVRKEAPRDSRGSLGEELRAERERLTRKAPGEKPRESSASSGPREPARGQPPGGGKAARR